jgi:5-methylcytosine-specific restriction endonuclease McrA
MVSKTQSKHQAKGCWIRKEKRLAIYIRDNFKCCYCEKDLRNVTASDVNLDHIVPKSYGGSNNESNLITSCKSCNCSRQDKSVEEYATSAALARIELQRYQALNIRLAQNIIRGFIDIDEA